jgi:hypothetical protein
MSNRTISEEEEARFFSGVRTASEFFMGKADVQKALDGIAGVMAINA